MTGLNRKDGYLLLCEGMGTQDGRSGAIGPHVHTLITRPHRSEHTASTTSLSVLLPAPACYVRCLIERYISIDLTLSAPISVTAHLCTSSLSALMQATSTTDRRRSGQNCSSANLRPRDSTLATNAPRRASPAPVDRPGSEFARTVADRWEPAIIFAPANSD
jgi:hypothetical protein